jgi:hypothetical protein
MPYPLLVFLPILFEMDLYVKRAVLEHFVFDYKNAKWNLFRRELDSRMDLNFSLDRIMSQADFDSMVQTFNKLILEVGVAAILFVRPNRFCHALSLQINSIIAQKNNRLRVWQNSRNTQERVENATLNNLEMYIRSWATWFLAIGCAN